MIDTRSATGAHPLVIGVCRDNFVVLAAGRPPEEWGGSGPERLLLHPTLPLGVVVTGLAELRDPRSGRPVETLEVVRRVVAEIGQPSELVLERIEARLANRLQPLLRETRRDPALHVVGAVGWVDVLIGFHNGRSAGMGRLRVGEGLEISGLRNYLDAAEPLQAYYGRGAYASPGALFGDRLSEPLFVAHHVQQVMSDGLRQTGTVQDVEVATITAKGARLIA